MRMCLKIGYYVVYNVAGPFVNLILPEGIQTLHMMSHFVANVDNDVDLGSIGSVSTK